jgi:hypothetical protein
MGKKEKMDTVFMGMTPLFILLVTYKQNPSG